MSTEGGPVLHLACQGDGLLSCPPISYAAANYISIEWIYKECKAWF